MGYKNNDPCLNKAYQDERLFILMTRDPSAPKVVVEWIKENTSLFSLRINCTRLWTALFKWHRNNGIFMTGRCRRRWMRNFQKQNRNNYGRKI